MQPRIVHVIDDDPGVLESTEFLLHSFGYDCETFADPKAFLESIDRLRPGCILTDLRMPNVSGFRLAEAVHSRSDSWPVLLMTSESGPQVAAEARARGFLAVLQKPLDVKLLTSALDRGFAQLDRSEA